MKKKLLSTLSLLMLYFGSIAQTNIANYTFTASTSGVYTPITGATTFVTTWDNQISASIPIGGNFIFGGATYTACYISGNGFIAFGAAPAGANYTPMNTLGATTGAISAFGLDAGHSTVVGAAPAIRYANVGSEFVVEFKDYASYNGKAAEMLNFQIRLNLTTNQINIIYGPCTVPSSAYTAQVGLRGNTTTWTSNVNSLLLGNIPASTTCNWADAVTNYQSSGGSIFNSTNTNAAPSNGLQYTWDAPAVAVAPVRAFSATSGITTTSALVAWTAPSGATQYNVQYRIPGTCAWTNFTGNPVSVASASLTGLTGNTIYQVRVQASNGTNNAIWSHIPDLAGSGNGYTAAGTFSTMALCPVPSALNFNALASTSANFTWTPGSSETNWDIYYGPQPLTAPTATTPPTTTTTTTSPSFSLTGLTANTAYAIYVRANCGGPNGVSVWSAVNNFTTYCANSPLPFTEGFNAATIPSCWTQQTINAPSGPIPMQFVTNSSNPTTTPFEGTHYVYFNSYSSPYTAGAEQRLVSPPITTTGTLSVDVNFRWFNNNNPTYTNLAEGVTVEYSFDGITWVTVQQYPRHDASVASGSGQWKLKTLTLPAVCGNKPKVFIGFKFHSEYGTNCSLDKVDINATPSCPVPGTPNSTNITSTSANFTWTPGATETNWDIYYGPQPLTAPVISTPPTTSTTSPSFSITGLTPSTAYAIYVRANCGGPSGTSAWTAVSNFTTACPNSPLPLSEGFNAATIPNCWSQQTLNAPSGPITMQFVTNSSNPTTTPFEGTHYVYFNSYNSPYTAGAEQRLITPAITTTGTMSVDVNFRWFNNNNPTYTNLAEGVTVEYSLDKITWVTVQQFPRHDASIASGSGQWNLKNVTLPAAAGNKPTIYVGFKFHSEYGTNCSLDKVDIGATPTCTQTPVAGTITGPNTLTVLTSGSYTISPSVGNLQWYTTTSPTSTVFTSIANATTTPISYTATGSGTVYLTVVASNPGCTNDTANVPFAVTINPLPGDMACSAVPLTVGPTTTYQKLFAHGVQTGEVVAPGTGCQTNNSWCNTTLNNTKWFSFVAPASGNVSVQSPGFDTQLAVWSATNCSMLTSTTASATLVAANDDDAQYTAHGGAQYSSYLRALCLTPGTTYYIQLDSYNFAVPNDSTKVEIIDLGANTFTTLASNYCIPAAANVTLTPNIAGGTFALNNPTTTISAFSPTAAGVGTHTVYYNAFGCISSSVTTVASTPTVLATLSSTAICAGGSITITASGATTYSWNTSSTNTVITASPTANTTYTVTGMNGICSSNTTAAIVVNALPTVSITGSAAICNGNTVTLTGNGATTYSWNTTATTSSINVSPIANTTYSVLGTDANNCSNTATFALTVNANPTVNISSTNTTICSGASVTFTASGATTYSWNTTSTNTVLTVSPTANTVYTVVGTTGSCTNSAVQSVSVNATPTVGASSSASLICNGQTASLTATGANTYSWNTTSTNTVIAVSPTVTTSYTVTGTTNGCSSTFIVSQAVSPCTGLSSNVATSIGILVYPNPNTGMFTIELNNGSVKNIDVMDLTGRIVASKSTSNDKADFEINNLANGVYYVRIQSNNSVEVIKIIKQ